VKPFTGKLSIGAGRPSGSWLILLLLLAVLVPSVCLLWFMNQAVHNERLAVRQKLIDAYRVNLALARDQLVANWTKPGPNPDLQPAAAPALFARQVRDGLADAVICFDAAGHVIYPGAVSPPRSEPPDLAWTAAEGLESADPASASAAFSRLAKQTTDANVAGRALQAQARCLVRAGKKAEAISVLTGPLEDERYQHAADAQGRLVVPSAELMVLELANGTNSAPALLAFDRLKKRLLDYDDGALSAPQRRFLMRELEKLHHDPAILRMLSAEDLAARYLETNPRRSEDPALRATSLPGIWQSASGRGQVVSLHQSDHLFARMGACVSPQLLPTDASLTFLPPGKEFERFFLSLPAGPDFPDWRLALSLNDQRLFDTAADQRIASYVWIGALVVATVTILAALALRLVRRQMALTQLRNDLVANVTHELKTPLASMRLLVDTLLNSQPLDEPTAREYLQLIAQENLRLSRLIDNFLTFSRMERNKYAFGFKPVPASAIIEGAAAAVRERFNAPGCRFVTEVPSNLPSVVADADAMVTAVVNLLDNAYKYTGDEKRIVLTAGSEDGNVYFAVKDNGIGLSPRDTKRIFKRFFQVDQRLSRSSSGCGLGLSIVKFIVTAHHGSVRVESQPGRGSTFVLSIPGVVAQPAQQPGPLTTAATTEGLK
jgi:signal transduction histidine kinase